MPEYLEAALRRDRMLMGCALALVVLIASAYTVAGVGTDMSAISMTFEGMDAIPAGAVKAMPMAAGAWSAAKVVLMVLMWWLMMIAMMLPSAAPAILLYASVLRRSRAPVPHAAIVFTAGYLIAWAGFSLAAAGAQLALEAAGLVSPSRMLLVSDPAGALVAIAAGAYQFTPLKDRCLALCRAPAEFIARHHRPGTLGAMRLGVLHGAYCLGCCIALMALLFVGGVMNLYWILGLAAIVAIEKLGARGHLLARVTGGLLIGFGIAKLGMF